MDIRHLQYFVVVAQELNVSRAARTLRISQPALSRQIRDLEVELGVPLFDRSAKRLRLTGAGHDLRDQARKVLGEVEAFGERALALRGEDAGVLRVGATPQTLERLFPPVLERYARSHPRVDIQLVEAHPASVVDLLSKGDLDLGLTLHDPDRTVGSRSIGVVPLLAVRKAGARGRASALELRELASERLLLFKRGFGSRDLFDAACRVAGFQPKLFLESSAAATLLAFVRAGAAVAVLPGSVSLPAKAFHVQRLQFEGKLLEARLAVRWSPQRFQPEYARRFIDEVTAQAHDEYALPSVQRRAPRASLRR